MAKPSGPKLVALQRRLRRLRVRAKIASRKIFGRKVIIDGNRILQRISEIWGIDYSRMKELEKYLNSQECVLAAAQLLSPKEFRSGSLVSRYHTLKRKFGKWLVIWVGEL